MAISERVAYLKGLAEGLGLQEKDKTGKFYNELMSLLEEMALVVDYLQDEKDELEEYLDALDEDLSDVEDVVFDLDDDEFDDDDFEDYDFNTLGNYMETECPGCGKPSPILMMRKKATPSISFARTVVMWWPASVTMMTSK